MVAALQIQAESQFLKDYGQMQKDLAEARQQHAEAGKLEGEAAIQKVLNNIKLREIKEADHAKQVQVGIFPVSLSSGRKVSTTTLLSRSQILNRQRSLGGVPENHLTTFWIPTVNVHRSAPRWP